MNGDRKGPEGMGPQTGRGRGFCAGFDRPGCQDHPMESRGRGLAGRGLMNGRGRGNLMSGEFGGKQEFGYYQGKGLGKRRGAMGRRGWGGRW